MIRSILVLIGDPFKDAVTRLSVQIPAAVAAIVMLLIGMFLARALRALTEKALTAARLDQYTSRIGINEILARLGMGKSPSYVLAFLIHWSILFVFIVAAANAANMTVVADRLDRLALFLPSLIGALLIVFGGLMFARFLGGFITNAATANNIRGGTGAARLAEVGVFVFTALTALEQIGVRPEFIAVAGQILLCAAGLAAAIAFGLGGKELAAELLRDFISRH